MLGAIIGDIIGSRFEVLEIKKLQTYEDRIKIIKKQHIVDFFNYFYNPL